MNFPENALTFYRKKKKTDIEEGIFGDEESPQRGEWAEKVDNCVNQALSCAVEGVSYHSYERQVHRLRRAQALIPEGLGSRHLTCLPPHFGSVLEALLPRPLFPHSVQSTCSKFGFLRKSVRKKRPRVRWYGFHGDADSRCPGHQFSAARARGEVALWFDVRSGSYWQQRDAHTR